MSSTKSQFIVTIDGPAGVGKSTLARSMAARLGIAYLDTGAMFRCFALHLGAGAELLPAEELKKLCAQWQFSLSGGGASTALLCNGTVVGNEIRTEEVALWASRLATVPAVRDILKAAQQSLGQSTSLVAEGRDMGSVVFPAARFKFFLDASAEIRAKRRQLQLQEQGQEVNLQKLTEQIRQRDSLDRGRAVAPLCPAAGAIIIDTSELDIDAVLARMLQETAQ